MISVRSAEAPLPRHHSPKCHCQDTIPKTPLPRTQLPRHHFPCTTCPNTTFKKKPPSRLGLPEDNCLDTTVQTPDATLQARVLRRPLPRHHCPRCSHQTPLSRHSVPRHHCPSCSPQTPPSTHHRADSSSQSTTVQTPPPSHRHGHSYIRTVQGGLPEHQGGGGVGGGGKLLIESKPLSLPTYVRYRCSRNSTSRWGKTRTAWTPLPKHQLSKDQLSGLRVDTAHQRPAPHKKNFDPQRATV